MALYAPAYRVTVYASRTVDPTEATVLTPRAGAAHAEPFIVTTGIGGGRPYLVTAPAGRKGRLDPVTKRLDTGAMSFTIQDARTTPGGSHAVRWVTAFVGDAVGASALLGLRLRVEESLDGGTTWRDFFVGRIHEAGLNANNPGEFVITARSIIEDAARRVFVSHAPTPGEAIPYLWRRPAWPLVNVPDFLNPGVPPYAQCRVTRVAANEWRVQFVKPPYRSTMPPTRNAALYEDGEFTLVFITLVARNPVVVTSAPARVVFGGSIMSPTGFDHALEFRVTSAAALNLVSHAAVIPTNGIAAAPNEQWPLWLLDAHPAMLVRHVLQGRFGLGAGAVAVDAASFAAIEADSSFLPMRFRIPEPVDDAVEWLEEHVLAPNNLALRESPDALFSLVDLRRRSALPTLSTITEADALPDRDAEWTTTQADAVALARTAVYADTFVDGEWKETDSPIVLLSGAPRAVDVNGQDVALQGKGWRFAPGELSPTNQGLQRRTMVQQYAAARLSEVLELFGTGSVTFSRWFARDLTRDATWHVGTWHVVESSVFPNLASNQRGGQRVALIVEREEDGPAVRLSFMDGGPNTVAVVPVVGTPTVDPALPRHRITCPITTNAARDNVEWQFAVVADGAAIPTAGSAWTHGGVLTWATGENATKTVTVDALPSGRRVYVRARCVRAAGDGRQLPSAYVASAPVTTNAMPTPASVTASAVAGDPTVADVAWTNTDTVAPVFVDVQPAGGLRGRVLTLSPGSASVRVRGLVPATTYTLFVGYLGAIGDDGPAPSAAVTTSASAVRPLAGVTAGGVEDAESGIIGVPVYVFPADPELPVEVVSAPDLSGSPDWANGTSTILPAGVTSYTDQRSNTALRRWYRARHIAGGQSSEWTAPVFALPRRVPLVLPPPPTPPVPGIPDVTYQITPAGDVTVQVVGDATTVGHRVVVTTTGPADVATLRAAPLRRGRVVVVSGMGPITPADAPFYVTALAENAAGGESDPAVVAAQRVGYALPTPTIGAALPGTTGVSWPVTFDALTAYLDVYATEFLADPGNPTSQETGAPPVASLTRGQGQSQVTIPIARGDAWVLVTFVPFDALGRRGTVVNRKAQGAGVAVTPPNSPTALTVASVTTNSVTLNATMPLTNLPFWLVVERDGAPYRTIARSAGAGVVQSLVVDGLEASTAYRFRVRGLTAAGVYALAPSPEVTGTTGSTALGGFSTLTFTTGPAVDLSPPGTFVDLSWTTGFPVHPAGTLYRVERRYTAGGAWTTVVETVNTSAWWLEFSTRTPGVDLFVRVVATYPGLSDAVLVVA